MASATLTRPRRPRRKTSGAVEPQSGSEDADDEEEVEEDEDEDEDDDEEAADVCSRMLTVASLGCGIE
jgi:hypothetical protein